MGKPYRSAPNKHKSTKRFNRHEKKSHPFNHMISRGGWRL